MFIGDNGSEKCDRQLIERLNKAPVRFTFHIDVSEQSPVAARHYLWRMKERWRQRQTGIYPPGA